MADARGKEEPPEESKAGLAVVWVTEDDTQWRTRG